MGGKTGKVETLVKAVRQGGPSPWLGGHNKTGLCHKWCLQYKQVIDCHSTQETVH